MSEHASVKGKKRIMWYERSRPNPINYVNNCATIPNWQKHHVLPCTSVRRSIATAADGPPEVENLEKAIKYFTSWNINEAHNLLPLPTRAAYAKIYGKKGGKASGINTIGNFPCHQPTSWGHTVYNERVLKDLVKIWANVKIKVKDHKLEANDISTDITTEETRWKEKVTTDRVGVKQPTQANWRAMFLGQGKAYNNFTMVNLDDSPV
jgi:hypothetical protein